MKKYLPIIAGGLVSMSALAFIVAMQGLAVLVPSAALVVLFAGTHAAGKWGDLRKRRTP